MRLETMGFPFFHFASELVEYPHKQNTLAEMIMDNLVFISYSRSDGRFVDRLSSDLEKLGIKVWIDRSGLKPGTRNWDEAIRNAIRICRAVILVASPSSRQSDYVQGELGIAEMYDRLVYPIWATGEHWADCISLNMIKTQYIDGRGDAYNNAIEQMIKALQTTQQKEEISPEPIRNFEPRNPYKGLHYFTAHDRKDFFGRDRFIQEIINEFPQNISQERFLALVGPSGSGKSSLVMAGLLPALQDGAVPTSDGWIYLNRLVPGTTPLENLSISLKQALPELSLKSILNDLESSTRSLHKLTGLLVKNPRQKVVLFVDQFEELFTATVSEDERRQFINLLVNTATEYDGVVIVILTLRADFYDRPMSYPTFGKLLEKYSKLVLRMEQDELREVIQKPAEQQDVHLTFEDGLIGDLLFDAQEQAGTLPLLQFALDQLFERRSGHLLTMAAYLRIGGIRGALAKHAELIYQSLPSPQHSELARSLFLRLIDPGTTEQDTRRRRASLKELETSDPTQTQMMQSVYETFVRARLLVTDQIAGETSIEVSHEALIREWERLAQWVREAREDVRFQQIFTNDVKAWLRYDKSTDYLYYGAKLREALNWSERNTGSRDELDFIRLSLSQEQEKIEQEQRRQSRLHRMRLSGHLISSSEPSQGLLELVVKEAANIFDLNAVSVSICDEAAQYYVIQAAFGLSESFIEKRRISRQQYTVVVDEGRLQPVYIQYPHNVLDPHQMKLLEEENIRGFLLVPLIRGNQIAGGLELYTKGDDHHFSDEDIEFVQVLASQVVIALDNAELIQTLKRRVEELADAREMADSANRAKSAFFANMSHELRTPLNAIIGYGEMILMGVLGDINEKIENRLQRMVDNAKKVLELVNDVLDISRIETGRFDLNLEILNPSEIVPELVTSFNSSASAKQIKLMTDVAGDLYPVKADRIRLKQMIVNLFTNAIKFTSEGGNVTLRMRTVTKQSSDRLLETDQLPEGIWVQIIVEDTGIGIAPEDQERIFREFEVISSPTTHYGGAGLGLAIVKRFADLHNGHVWVESKVGEGSKFYIALPAHINDLQT